MICEWGRESGGWSDSSLSIGNVTGRVNNEWTFVNGGRGGQGSPAVKIFTESSSLHIVGHSSLQAGNVTKAVGKNKQTSALRMHYCTGHVATKFR